MFLLGPKKQPLPLAYRWAVANGLVSFTPWHLETGERSVEDVSKEFSIESGVECWVFAYRQDMDDAAAFVMEDGVIQEEVVSTHLAWYRKREWDPDRFVNFWDWITRQVIPDMTEWEIEEGDIEDALKRRAV